MTVCHLRGCQEHFRQSITRIKRNSAVIPMSEAGDFQRHALNLLQTNLKDEFTSIVIKITNTWKFTKNWIDFWTQSHIKSMLFPSHSILAPDLDEALPSTTNAQEALHKLYFYNFGRDHDLIAGFHKLLCLLRSRLFKSGKRNLYRVREG